MTNPNDVRAVSKGDFYEQTRFKIIVPRNLTENLSETSYCENCFAGQQFSRKLQIFMLDYSLKVTGKFPLTDNP